MAQKTIILLVIFSAVLLNISATLAQAPGQGPPQLIGGEAAGALAEQDAAFIGASGLGTASPALVVSQVIKVILSLLGVVFILLIIYGGFLWLTSAGNEETVSKAKRLLTAAIIGLIIVLAAYVITVFVIDRIVDATTSRDVFRFRL
jgi:hypothetical protein